MSLAEQLKKDFSTVTLTLIPVAIVLNMVIGQLASAVKLPVFLDSIGTILVGILAGPWAGLLTGVMTNLIWGLISSPVAAAFAPVAGVIGLVAGLCARAGLVQCLVEGDHRRGVDRDRCLVYGSADPGLHVWRHHRQRRGLHYRLPAENRQRPVWCSDHHRNVRQRSG
jgi:hypothetical protein